MESSQRIRHIGERYLPVEHRQHTDTKGKWENLPAVGGCLWGRLRAHSFCFQASPRLPNHLMSKQTPIVERGVIAGNYYDKHTTVNPVARALVDGFYRAFDELVMAANPSSIHEVGCGEGHLIPRYATGSRQIRATDFSPEVLNVARETVSRLKCDIEIETESVYEMDPERDSAELVICCEVLEHLERPSVALSVLAKLADPWLLVSVPREPVWRILNVARGKYLSDLGNTPGHLQHWSKGSFLTMVERFVDIVEVRCPFPWTMVLGRRSA